MNSHKLFSRVGAAAAALTFALSLAAQSGNSGSYNSTRPTDNATSESADNNSTSHSRHANHNGELSRADRHFLKKAAESGMKEVTVSQSVMSNLTVPAVRDFAQTMVNDHSAANRELMTLAQRKGVSLDDHDAQKDMDKFSRKWSSKSKADEDYIKEMIDDHEDAVKLFEKASKSDDPDIAAFAQKTLPTLQHHLQMAKSDKDLIPR